MLSSDAITTVLRGSIRRQYTPPTCSLVVTAKCGASWFRSKTPQISRVRFELSFDDPRLPDEQQKTVRGDKAQLDRLCDAVTTYVGHLLAQPPQPTAVAAGGRRQRGDRWPVTAASIAPLPYRSDSIYLQPKGFVSHELVLGSLATEETGTAIRLGTLQLFDLAAALEEYAADLGQLPERDGSIDPLPLWMSAAAGVVATLGLTAALGRLDLARSPQPTPITVSALESSPADAPEPLPQRTLPPAPKNLATPPPLSRPTVPPPTSIDPTPIEIPTSATPVASSDHSRRATPSGETPSSAAEETATPIPNAPAMMAAPTTEPTVSPIAPTVPEVRFDEVSPSEAPFDSPQVARTAPPPRDLGTAFDVVPQVAEVRRYFQDRWQPPDGLTQTLEYTLSIDAEGRLETVVPLGKTATQFIDSAKLPDLGETFVSPANSGVSLRLVLGHDGRVQTFVQ
ncbi:DUF4335 domain-containing protein [Baaleninema sp.]|uniref:DUF4335 domain-containing protein n=1 Tax=Baaleninema sp. TaxID=3101197 RepID=UPI003D04482D